MVAGIDFMPDRYQSNSHDWRSDFHRFQLQWHNRGMDAALGFDLFRGEFMLWHDTGVLVEGTVVANLEMDFVRRWNAGDPAGTPITPPTITPTAGNHNVQVVKTDFIPHPGDEADIHYRGTLDAYRHAILEARHYVYIENQYFNYTGLGDLLVDALGRNSALQVIVVLPFNTEEALSIGAHTFTDAYFWNAGALNEREVRARMYMHGLYLQSQLITRLRAVPRAADRVGIYALAGCAGGAVDMIYPHSKLTIVDDTWAIIGSANTNGRGFVADAEMNIVIHKRSFVTPLRTALWKEHIGVELTTRRIRDFVREWNARAVSPRNHPSDCTCAEVATVHAVKLRSPPRGQAYSGPGNWLPFVDDAV
jgi:phosphatidylserine/phosphatidylglycerophosphate/cardiolipin synthase-like enzyme